MEKKYLPIEERKVINLKGFLFWGHKINIDGESYIELTDHNKRVRIHYDMHWIPLLVGKFWDLIDAHEDRINDTKAYMNRTKKW